jgi:hypothetical protein
MKILTFLLLFLSFVYFNLVFAQLNFPIATTPPAIRCTNFEECAQFLFVKILKILLVLSSALAVIFVAWAGILYILKGKDDKAISSIHQMIIWAIIGLIVSLISYSLIKIIESGVRKELEEVLKTGYFYVSYFYNFINSSNPLIFFLTVNAQSDSLSTPRNTPSLLPCGLKSVFQSTNPSSDVWNNCLIYYIQKIFQFLYYLALAFGVIFLMLAGISYITNPENIKETHKKVVYALVGVVLAILSLSIVRLVGLFFNYLGSR